MTNYGFGVFFFFFEVEQSQKQWQVIGCIKEQQVQAGQVSNLIFCSYKLEVHRIFAVFARRLLTTFLGK